MKNEVYCELKSRYEKMDFAKALPQDLCQALDCASAALNFISRVIPEKYQASENQFWYTVAFQARHILQSQGFSVFFVNEVKDLVDVLYKGAEVPDKFEYVCKGALPSLSLEQLGELIDAVLDDKRSGRNLVLHMLQKEIESRSK